MDWNRLSERARAGERISTVDALRGLQAPEDKRIDDNHFVEFIHYLD